MNIFKGTILVVTNLRNWTTAVNEIILICTFEPVSKMNDKHFSMVYNIALQYRAGGGVCVCSLQIVWAIVWSLLQEQLNFTYTYH